MILALLSLSSFLSGTDEFSCLTNVFSRCFLGSTHFRSTSIFSWNATKISAVDDFWEILFYWKLFLFPEWRPSLLVLLVVIMTKVNSQSGPLLSDTFFLQVRYNGYMSFVWKLDSISGFSAFTMEFFSCNNLFAQIGDDAVIPRDYQLGGGSCGAAFTVTSYSSKISYSWFGKI